MKRLTDFYNEAVVPLAWLTGGAICFAYPWWADIASWWLA